MIYKKKGLFLSLFVVVSIQILLVIDNNQKSSFRYFLWNLQSVSIGKLICLSFISGLLMSSVLNKIVSDNKIPSIKNDDHNINNDGYSINNEEYSINNEENIDSPEMPPERDLRDTQPTISVNYRVIKNIGENDLKDSQNNQDDWKTTNNEW